VPWTLNISGHDARPSGGLRPGSPQPEIRNPEFETRTPRTDIWRRAVWLSGTAQTRSALYSRVLRDHVRPCSQLRPGKLTFGGKVVVNRVETMTPFRGAQARCARALCGLLNSGVRRQNFDKDSLSCAPLSYLKVLCARHHMNSALNPQHLRPRRPPFRGAQARCVSFRGNINL